MERIKIYIDDGQVLDVESTMNAQDVRVEIVEVGGNTEDSVENNKRDDILMKDENFIIKDLSMPARLREDVLNVLRGFDELTEVPGAEYFTVYYPMPQNDRLSDKEIYENLHVDDEWAEFRLSVWRRYCMELDDLYNRIDAKISGLPYDGDTIEEAERLARDMIQVKDDYDSYLDQEIMADIVLWELDPHVTEYMHSVILAKMSLRDLFTLLYAGYPVTVKAGTHMSYTDLNVGPGFPEAIDEDMTIDPERIYEISPDSCQQPYNFSGFDRKIWKEDAIVFPKEGVE